MTAANRELTTGARVLPDDSTVGEGAATVAVDEVVVAVVAAGLT